MDSERLNEAWISLESAIDDWVIEYHELVRHPETFSAHSANAIFEEVLGLKRDSVDGWESSDDN